MWLFAMCMCIHILYIHIIMFQVHNNYYSDITDVPFFSRLGIKLYNEVA